MKKLILPLLLAVFGVLMFLMINLKNEKPAVVTEKKPSEWFYSQRAFPYQDINYVAYREALEQAREMKMAYKNRDQRVSWEFAGPINIGGRLSAVAIHPTQINTFYVGAASGGIFKTEDGGLSWESIFDDQLSLSIGDIAVAPSNPEVIYVGTGEANAGGGSVSYDGLGIFRSGDGGSTWTHTGLEESGSIGRLVVHPQNPDICYVAAMGRMFSTNNQRGIFKTTDGGQNWQNVLFISDSTGGIDVVIDPQNPETIYAAMWERTRRPDQRVYGGISCGIYRSYNGGNDWTELTNGLPSPSINVGRIGISVSPSNPAVLYSIYADKTGYFDGVYKSSNHGDSWTRTNDGSMSNFYSSYGWWFGRLRVDPVNPDIVYAIGFDLFKTSNGGSSWSNIGYAVHVDQHDIYAHPMNHNFVVLGNDGGVYTSQNGGSTWTHIENMPIMQFYTSEIDQQHPERLYGGAQDNGTNRTLTGNIDDWTSIYGGDGFVVKVNPENNQYIYAEYQYGGLGRSTNGGASFQGATNGINSSDRFNWMSPLTFNPANPAILYFGSNKLYKSTNHAASWTAISPDLTNGAGQYNQTYGTTTTIAVSPINQDIIYVGTDDGNVWVTQSNGSFWTKISENLPERWVTRVAADPYNEATAYVTFSGYRYDEYLPHIFRTDDFGQTWTDISGDLPEAPINDIIVDPTIDSALYIATDVGVFVSWNLGQNWGLMGEGLPNVPALDLTFQPDLRMLVIATYGRSMYKIYLDDFVGLSQKTVSQRDFELFPNPASETIKILLKTDQKFDRFSIINTAGSTVLSGVPEFSGRSAQIDISALKAGSYVLRLEGEKSISTATFIIK